MRGVYNSVTDIRRKVFAAIAKMAYDDNIDLARRIEEIPYEILPGTKAKYRTSIFLERAIIGERLRLGMGLPVRDLADFAALGDGIEESAIATKYYDPPLVNIIKFACNACPEKKVFVTNACQGCLSHQCTEVCPKDAIHIVNGRSLINDEKCIKCGKCMEACPYHAIVKLERPCSASCGMDAIKSDEDGKAIINYDKCVSCGQCLVSCPFGAIVGKGQIFQTIYAMKEGYEVIAAIAPAFVGQFGPSITPPKVRAALQQLGFADVVEVSIGADLCAIEEAEDFLNKVPDKQPFMATSCCPAWSVMAKKEFPQFAPYISMALTPMVLTGRLIKKKKPNAKVVFIGPCAAKKLEASRKSIRSDIDFVLTFEEVMGMFEAKGIDMNQNFEETPLREGSNAGRNFAVSGGVAKAVKDLIEKKHPEMDVKVQSAEGLKNCKTMLMMAKAGRLNGYLLEGMACPGGCVAGAGTLQPITKSTALVKKLSSDPTNKAMADESEYKDMLKVLSEMLEEFNEDEILETK
ncbi:MAG: 4Fe-4S dicluster domain-containing protein [Holdemanella sp.]|nr:4Fe-4S dicluster domain-containing protein [Holdemanella sp.]